MGDVNGCSVSEIGVCDCKAWLGARVAGYPGGEDFSSQHEGHEGRIGRKLDLVHSFHRVGALPLVGPHERAFATRDNTFMVSNWKPVTRWGFADGQEEKVNAWIDKAAETVKSIAPAKLWLVLHHEPENDVGSYGTPDEYRQMWRLVRDRFDAAGVDNVIWVMAYMNYPKWNSMVAKLYPGDQLVDWVMFNAYGSDSRPSYRKNVGGFIDYLDEISGGNVHPADKPLGIIEWGISADYGRVALDYFNEATESLDAAWAPRLKAHMIFDSPGHQGDGGLRVGYDAYGKVWQARQDAYNAFTGHSRFMCAGHG